MQPSSFDDPSAVAVALDRRARIVVVLGEHPGEIERVDALPISRRRAG